MLRDVLETDKAPISIQPISKGDHEEVADKIGAFLTRPEVVPRIEDAFFKIEEPRLQKLVSDAIY